MTEQDTSRLMRYQRQMAFEGMGLAAQRRLSSSGALIVGAGGLGSWIAELLARSGVGFLRLVDSDKVDLTNLHRQSLYTEADARAGTHKVHAAAAAIAAANSDVRVEPVVVRLDKTNIASLAEGVQILVDGTDNFATRFIINDYAVKYSIPWVFAGVVSAEGQTMTIVPGQSPCLRCVFDSPPPPCADPNCRVAGVIAPAVAAVAAIAAAEAQKILAGRADLASPWLLKLDLWNNSVQRIDVREACRRVDCPCCKGGHFDFLES
jgi:adenylyltransferase/sulfurtransferase